MMVTLLNNVFRSEQGIHPVILSELNEQVGSKSNPVRFTPTKNIQTITKDIWIPKWQHKLFNTSYLQDNLLNENKFFLAAAFRVRIYSGDKANWTTKELRQWFHYMFWAGVEHIFLCDHFIKDSESLKDQLQRYIKLNLITYIPWNVGKHTLASQVECYQHIIDKYGKITTWQIAIDMDEYPYIHNDTEEGFLTRYLHQFSQEISEISMPNYLMLGKGDFSKNLTIERINRIESLTKKSNNLDKPIYRPGNVKAGMHHNHILRGNLHEEDGKIIKMLHYWGSRLQNWGPDTPEILQRTVPFTEVRSKLAPIIRKSLLAFGEMEAFSNSTGP